MDWDSVLKRWNLETSEPTIKVNFDLIGDDDYLGALSADSSRFVFSKQIRRDDQIISDDLHVIDTVIGEVTRIIEINPETPKFSESRIGATRTPTQQAAVGRSARQPAPAAYESGQSAAALGSVCVVLCRDAG